MITKSDKMKIKFIIFIKIINFIFICQNFWTRNLINLTNHILNSKISQKYTFKIFIEKLYQSDYIIIGGGSAG